MEFGKVRFEFDLFISRSSGHSTQSFGSSTIWKPCHGLESKALKSHIVVQLKDFGVWVPLDNDAFFGKDKGQIQLFHSMWTHDL